VASTHGDNDRLELEFKNPQQINHVVIMEDISRGERILKYVVEYVTEGETWRKLCMGQSVGHKRIQQFDTVRTSGIRLRVTKAKADPHIRRLAVHLVTETG
jgi:alpha-L-fucosidase